jgi:predicted nucleic acid-binding protein
MAHYVDTSALVKLVLDEAETPALAAWVGREAELLVTSALSRTELIRAVRRAAPARLAEAISLLGSLGLSRISGAVLDRAGVLDPPALRSLDALHLASALELGDELTSVVTYDERLAAAATARGIAVTRPA